MRWIADFFLKNYDARNKELFLKARFVILVALAVILATVITIGHSIWIQGLVASVMVQILTAFVMAGAIGLLVMGRYTWAVHIIFTAGFASLWLVMFIEPPSPVLAKVDSIVLVIGLFSAMNVAFFKTRHPIVLYLTGNALAMVLYMGHLYEGGILPPGEIVEYFFDNAVALIFVFIIAFNAVAINRKVYSELRGALLERKRAEKALVESQRMLADHLKSTPVGSIFWDLEFRVTEWNPSAERIFGYSRQEVLGQHVEHLILPDDVKAHVEKVFGDLLSGRGGERSVNENLTKSGSRIVCDWYNAVLKDADGKVVGVASLVNDITEKVRTQEMIIQSEKMMSVGGLAAGMAHEVNNPLSGIIQNAQLISQRLTSDIPANRKAAEDLGIPLSAISAYARERSILKQLDQIGETGLRALKVIENMLSFSRKSDAVREAVDIVDLMDSTLALAGHDHAMELRYAFRHIQLVREYDAGLPKIFCERTKIQQVLLNLLKNASDSMNQKEYGSGAPGLSFG